MKKIFYVLFALCFLFSSRVICEEKSQISNSSEENMTLDWDRVKPKEPPSIPVPTEEEIEEIKKEKKQKEEDEEKQEKQKKQKD